MSAFRNGDRVSLLATVKYGLPAGAEVAVVLPDGSTGYVKPADLQLVKAVFEVGDEVRRHHAPEKGVILAMTSDGEDALVEWSGDRRGHIETARLNRWNPEDEATPPKDDATGNAWIDWDGSLPRPVSAERLIDVMYRSGLIEPFSKAKEVLWTHAGGPSDVIAFRFVAEN